MNRPDETGDRLEVRLNDVFVGELVRSNEGSVFVVDPGYLELPDRPVLGQVFEDAPFADHWVRQGVAPWFSNLLPEGPLRELVSARAGVHPTRSFFLLATLGLDLPGAVIIERKGEVASEVSAAGDVEPSVATDQPLKFSLAGVQLKFSARRNDRGLTIPAQGLGGDWIVKLPDQRFAAVPENEYATMRWAGAAGIAIPEVALVDVKDLTGLPEEVLGIGGCAFVIRRFDRGPDGSRIHIEDFAQVLNQPPAGKYGTANFETIARILAATTTPDDVDEFVRRLVFQVLAGNGDAHLKNWSLIYEDPRRPRLSPAYDLLCTVAYMPEDQLGLNLAGRKRFEDVDEDLFARLAERAGIDAERVRETVGDQVVRTREAWEQIRREDWVGKSLKAVIDDRLSRLRLSRA